MGCTKSKPRDDISKSLLFPDQITFNEAIEDPKCRPIVGTKEVRILSIDGGGIRGVLPAIILREIQKKTGKHPTDLFDLFAGTSIGGILSIGMNISDENNKPRFNCSDLVNFFVEDGKNIFKKSWSKTWESKGGLCDEKYESGGIETFLEKNFKDRKMSESIKPVVVTSFEVERYKPMNFKSWDDSQQFLCSFAARSTSAAPTFFELARGKHLTSGEKYSCIDGGVINNNPSLIALTEAKKLFPDATKFYILSLGTGKLQDSLDSESVKDWGALEWIQPLINLMMEGTSQTAHIHLKNLLPKENYVRMQIKLNKELNAMDNTSKENIENLVNIAEKFVELNKEVLDSVCAYLLTSRS